MPHGKYNPVVIFVEPFFVCLVPFMDRSTATKLPKFLVYSATILMLSIVGNFTVNRRQIETFNLVIYFYICYSRISKFVLALTS